MVYDLKEIGKPNLVIFYLWPVNSERYSSTQGSHVVLNQRRTCPKNEAMPSEVNREAMEKQAT